MAPSAIDVPIQAQIVSKLPLEGGRLHGDHHSMANETTSSLGLKKTEFLLDRNLHKPFPVVKSGKGNYLHLTDGRIIFDATSGAAVSCLGHGNQRVIDAISTQMSTGVPYLASCFWGSGVVEALCKELIDGTDGKMTRVYLTGSGTFVTSLAKHQTDHCRFRGHGIHN